jgi:hypothetical protein
MNKLISIILRSAAEWEEYGTLELAARAFVSGIGQSALNGPLHSIDDKQS